MSGHRCGQCFLPARPWPYEQPHPSAGLCAWSSPLSAFVLPLRLFLTHSSVALWGLSKKRPLALQREAHGLHGEPGLEQPFWVSSVAALLNTDLVATGGCSVRWGEGLEGELVLALLTD